MNKETLKTIVKMLENSASKDPTRFHLGCVEITKEYIQATDGIILSRCKNTDEHLKDIVGKYYVHRDEIGFLKAVLKNSPYGFIVGVEITEKDIKIEGKKITMDVGRYPDVNQFLPNWDASFEVGLNPELLLKLAVSMGLEPRRNKSQVVKLSFKDPISPIRVTVDNNEGVLMPMRIG
ncbi:MAG: hypothetical protein ACKOX6_11235 [Bdellovibrio sp.]